MNFKLFIQIFVWVVATIGALVFIVWPDKETNENFIEKNFNIENKILSNVIGIASSLGIGVLIGALVSI